MPCSVYTVYIDITIHVAIVVSTFLGMCSVVVLACAVGMYVCTYACMMVLRYVRMYFRYVVGIYRYNMLCYAASWHASMIMPC